jgi:hypothetical protein
MRERVSTGGWALVADEEFDGTRKHQVWLGGAKHRAGSRLRRFAEDHGRRRGFAKERRVLDVGEEGQIARPGFFDARHTGDVDLAVTFEAALEPRSYLAELQDAKYMSRGRNGRALEELEQVLELQGRGHRVDTPLALVAIEIDRPAQFRQRRTPLGGPADAIEPLPCAVQ